MSAIPAINAPLLKIESGPLNGIICMVVGMVFFVMQDAMMKTMLGPFTVWQLIGIRSLVSAIVLIPTILLLGFPHRLLTPFWPLHICRAFLFSIGFSLFYTAFPFMTLASATTIFFSAPLITAVLAAIFLREKVGLYRIAALIVGFCGVLIAMNPTSGSFQWISILPLICAVTYSISQIIMRIVGERDSTLTVGLYTIVFAGVFVIPFAWITHYFTNFAEFAPHLRWGWDELMVSETSNLILLGILGILGMIGYLLISRAYQVTEASIAAPFEYIYLPLATILGYVAWNEVPTWNTLVGMGFIVSSGIYIGYRELISARRKLTPAPTAEASFIPGSPPPPTL